MKSVKHIALGVLLTLGIFCVILYTSCSKNTCGSVTCLNGATCSGGSCQPCPAGTGGTNCEIVYRTLYSNTYTGNANYNSSVTDTNYHSHIDTNSTLVFSAANDSNFTSMSLVWNRASGKSVTMQITLSNNSSSGSDFSLVGPVNVDTFTYSGSGTVNGSVSSTTASLNLIETHPNSPPVIVSLNNFNRQ